MKNLQKFLAMLIIMVMLSSVVLPTFVLADESGEGGVYLPVVEVNYEQNEKELSPVEKMFAMLVNGIANALNYIVARAIGQQVVIDDLVFNEYPPTRIDYFKGAGATGISEIIWGDGTMPGLSVTVVECYSFFRSIAIIGYMIMLIYMGIRILLASTGQSVSHYKTLFMYWVTGVAILFLYPYVMKYTIKLNDGFVATVSANRSNYNVAPTRNSMKPISTSSFEDIDFSENAFESNGSDYMSQIANDANQGKRFAMALVYLILTWQLITLIIHYYKRVFMVGFLIAIFPLVVLFYALDKIGDGKSQAFNHWNKEFMLNVLIQSFHAVVYVFVCGSIYASYSANTGIDYILVIIGSTFLFTGEEIIKKIFSQSSPAGGVKSLKDTAAGTMAKVAVAKGIATAVTKPVIGKDSIVAKTKNSINQMKAADAKLAAFDSMAKPVEEPNVGMRLDHTQATLDAINNDSTLSDAQKRQKKAEAVELANAVAAINNPNSRSVEELQRAYSTVQKAQAQDPNNAILQDLKLTEDQMDALNGIGNQIAGVIAASGGVFDPVTIDREIQLRLGYVLDGMSDQERNKYKNMVLTNLAVNGGMRYDADPLGRVESEVDGGVEAIRNMMDSFVSKDRLENALKDAEASGDEVAKARIAQAQADAERDRAALSRKAHEWAASFHDGDESKSTHSEKAVARSMLIIANRKEGLYSTDEYLAAVTELKRNMDDTEATRKMAEKLDVDIDLLNHALLAQADSEGLIKSDARTHLRDYEKHSRDGLYDDELSGHDLVMIAMEKDPTKRNDLRNKVVKSMTEARQLTNMQESDMIRDVASEILVANEVDVTEGGLSTTKFLNGQTREDILKERKQAKQNMWRNLAGYKDTQATGGYSKEYEKAIDTYNAHFRGDQEGDYTYDDYTE